LPQSLPGSSIIRPAKSGIEKMWMTSALNKPLMVSAQALSWLSPTLPPKLRSLLRPGVRCSGWTGIGNHGRCGGPDPYPWPDGGREPPVPEHQARNRRAPKCWHANPPSLRPAVEPLQAWLEAMPPCRPPHRKTCAGLAMGPVRLAQLQRVSLRVQLLRGCAGTPHREAPCPSDAFRDYCGWCGMWREGAT